MAKTIFNTYKNQIFVGVTKISEHSQEIINSTSFKSRLPANMEFWIEENNENKYFLGIISDGIVLTWQESAALWDYLVNNYKSELIISEKLKNKQQLLDFIADCIEKEIDKNEDSTTIYIRNINSFKYSDLEKNVQQIIITHEYSEEI